MLLLRILQLGSVKTQSTDMKWWILFTVLIYTVYASCVDLSITITDPIYPSVVSWELLEDSTGTILASDILGESSTSTRNVTACGNYAKLVIDNSVSDAVFKGDIEVKIGDSIALFDDGEQYYHGRSRQSIYYIVLEECDYELLIKYYNSNSLEISSQLNFAQDTSIVSSVTSLYTTNAAYYDGGTEVLIPNLCTGYYWHISSTGDDLTGQSVSYTITRGNGDELENIEMDQSFIEVEFTLGSPVEKPGKSITAYIVLGSVIGLCIVWYICYNRGIRPKKQLPQEPTEMDFAPSAPKQSLTYGEVGEIDHQEDYGNYTSVPPAYSSNLVPTAPNY